MPEQVASAESTESTWHFAAPRAELPPGGVYRVRVHGRRIALFDRDGKIYACNDLCPHEGYPLSEGNLSGRCTLTCNWHNWKFDLETGDNLYGGDRLAVYPVALRGDEIWVDLAEPPPSERLRQVTDNLRAAFADESYDRIAREIARLVRLGGDPLDAARMAIKWSWQRMEFGWTHAYAGMADWLTLYHEYPGDAERQLVCLVEPVAHAAFDTRREADYPYPVDKRPWDEAVFTTAMEDEDEATAIACIRGALGAGLGYADLEKALTCAALAHYQDFGHSLIYVAKAGQLIELLGPSVTEPLMLSLVRSLIFASREDRIPEFRDYAEALGRWDEPGKVEMPAAVDWRGLGIRSSLARTLACRCAPEEDLYRELLLANTWNLLHFDYESQDRVRVPVSGNVGWLDFTHGLTFANAVQRQCSRFPELWPRGLLQMACFAGRNASHTVPAMTDDPAAEDEIRDPKEVLDSALESALNHGQGEYIVAVHLLKTTVAVREEAERLGGPAAAILARGLNRFLRAPLRRRRPRRTAWQSLRFVAREFGDAGVGEDAPD